jgi:tetratricopeptide (TPR) repeat protein
MSWQNEIDRTVHSAVLKGADDREPDWERMRTLVSDLVSINPARPESHFFAGLLETLERRGPAPARPAATPDSEVPTSRAELPSTPDGDPAIWRALGRLDGAARAGDEAAVRSLVEEPWAETALSRAREGRAVLRAAGRVLLAAGEEGKVFALYRRHLEATGEAASRKDAESLLNEVVRRADDMLSDGRVEDATQALRTLADFAEAAGLEERVRAKVDRKLGRAHQLAGRFEEAAECFRRAMGRLPEDDRYRAVLNGDLALAALRVRGTLDLLPLADRPGTREAEDLLRAGATGEGESYNAIYTLAMLAYERGDFATAADRFGEADRLMDEAHAKARIVHARARFFRGASLLRLQPTGDALSEAVDLVTGDASQAALDPALRDEIFDLLAAAAPGARIPGRGPAVRAGGGAGAPGRSRSDRPLREDRPARGERFARAERAPRASVERAGPSRGVGRAADGPRDPDRSRAPAFARAPAGPPRSEASTHLVEAEQVLARDPRAALQAVDRVFKSRPSFEEWFGAYRVRLVALLAIRERDEALRTYERFRAKLHERGRQDRLETLLSDGDGPLRSLFDDESLGQERVDLYEAMPDRSREFAEQCLVLARAHAAGGGERNLRKAVALLREAVSRDASHDDARRAFQEICERATAEGIDIGCPPAEAIRAKVASKAGGARVLVVGSDTARAPQAHALEDLGRRLGFEGAWIPAGARPLHQTLAEVEEGARKGASAILIHHSAGADLRASVRALAQDLSIPVREIAYAGPAGVEPEVLSALDSAL